jgi:hypothetical protein
MLEKIDELLTLASGSVSSRVSHGSLSYRSIMRPWCRYGPKRRRRRRVDLSMEVREHRRRRDV